MKKDLIRRVAIDVIAENGFHNATIEKIAKAGKIAVGTVYNYFEKKEDILNYIFQVEYEKRAKFLQKLSEGNLHTLEKIRILMDAHFSELSENPNLAKVLLKERSFVKQDKMNYIKRFTQMPSFVKDIIQDGVDKGLLRQCDPTILSIALFGCIEALMSQFIIENQYQSSAVLDNAVTEIANLLNQGLNTL